MPAIPFTQFSAAHPNRLQQPKVGPWAPGAEDRAGAGVTEGPPKYFWDAADIDLNYDGFAMDT